MPLSKPVLSLLCACVLAALIGSISLARGILSHREKPAAAVEAQTESAFSASFALVEKALSLPPLAAIAGYRGDFESPLKPFSEARESAGPVARRAQSAAGRPVLVLKGILYKSNPLAILEGAGGKTSILGVGDSISGRKVAGIGNASVTLRDKSGTYDLFIKE
jgi:hypothetical protein